MLPLLREIPELRLEPLLREIPELRLDDPLLRGGMIGRDERVPQAVQHHRSLRV